MKNAIPKRSRLTKKGFSNQLEVRRVAREVIGKVPGMRVIPDKRRKQPRHKERFNDVEHG